MTQYIFHYKKWTEGRIGENASKFNGDEYDRQCKGNNHKKWTWTGNNINIHIRKKGLETQVGKEMSNNERGQRTHIDREMSLHW